ncbi:unnamed protein product [Prorocentrum cordatum]|uniref:Uncharacterized protein n=1 Tax=Prorocentrum cordatum TaxID=2364126 RepID=A0ABN9RF80_9DINO|nr:unnamed protein product [Polarella glacialis]
MWYILHRPNKCTAHQMSCAEFRAPGMGTYSAFRVHPDAAARRPNSHSMHVLHRRRRRHRTGRSAVRAWTWPEKSGRNGAGGRREEEEEEEEENEGRRVSSSLAVDAARVGASRRPQKRGAPLCWRGGGRRPIPGAFAKIRGVRGAAGGRQGSSGGGAPGRKRAPLPGACRPLPGWASSSSSSSSSTRDQAPALDRAVRRSLPPDEIPRHKRRASAHIRAQARKQQQREGARRVEQQQQEEKQGGPAREKTSRARCEAYNAALHRRYTFS